MFAGPPRTAKLQGVLTLVHRDAGQNYGFFLGPLNTRCRITLRIQKGTIILTRLLIRGLDRNYINIGSFFKRLLAFV